MVDSRFDFSEGRKQKFTWAKMNCLGKSNPISIYKYERPTTWTEEGPTHLDLI